MQWTPLIRVTVNGKAVAGAFYTRLVKATVRDEEGQTSDTVSVTLDDADNALEVPSKGAEMKVEAGWREGGFADKGSFKVQSVEITGDDGGEFITIQGKAGDLKKKLKGDGHESHSNTTFGAIVRKYADRDGLQAVIDPALDKIPIPYKARTNQSGIDFLTRLADEHGGIIKPAGQKLIVAKRGAQTSASGKALAPVLVMKRQCESWRFTPEGRTQYGRVGAQWLDQKSGKKKTEWTDTGLKGPDHIIRELAADQARAKAQAQAETQRLNRATGSGSLTLGGLLEASAGAELVTAGFRPEANGSWRITAVEDNFDKSSGWKTTLEFKAKEDGKKGGYKDED